MKRIVTIQDISCIGKCSLTVALPIISATGIETAIIPTTVLSTHTAFKGYTFKDLSAEIPLIKEHWKKENFEFQAIYTGYLGNVEQIEMVKEFIQTFKTPKNLVIVDPAMADNGKLYPGFDSEFVSKMKELCQMADIIVPNLTEACLLLDIPYKTNYTTKELENVLKELAKITKKPIITDISIKNKIGVMSYDSINKIFDSYFRTKIPVKYHGTGDVFASSLVGSIANEISIEKSIRIATDFTWETIKETFKTHKTGYYGVDFETKLPYLINRIKKQ